MKVTPTLNFGGNCREAIQLYEKAFQGKITCLITYRQANDQHDNAGKKSYQQGDSSAVDHTDKIIPPGGICAEKYGYGIRIEEAVEKAENQELTICLERHLGYNYIRTVKIFKDGTGHDEENYRVVERIVKTLLWVAGGYIIYVCGSHAIYERLAKDYSKTGVRALLYFM